MKRLALFAIFQWLGITAFCQAPAITSGTAQTQPDKPSLVQPLFDFNSSQLGQISPSSKSTRTISCESKSASQKRPEARVRTGQFFHVPCLNLNTFAQVAQVDVPASPSSGGQWPGAKGLPIPTQWPDAKVEQIPTTWPDLKMLRISPNNPGPASQK